VLYYIFSVYLKCKMLINSAIGLLQISYLLSVIASCKANV